MESQQLQTPETVGMDCRIQTAQSEVRSRRTRSLVPICHAWRRLSQLLDLEPLDRETGGSLGTCGFKASNLGIPYLIFRTQQTYIYNYIYIFN